MEWFWEAEHQRAEGRENEMLIWGGERQEEEGEGVVEGHGLGEYASGLLEAM